MHYITRYVINSQTGVGCAGHYWGTRMTRIPCSCRHLVSIYCSVSRYRYRVFAVRSGVLLGVLSVPGVGDHGPQTARAFVVLVVILRSFHNMLTYYQLFVIAGGLLTIVFQSFHLLLDVLALSFS